MANIISATIETPIQVTERLRENFIWLPRYEELRVSVDGFLEQTLELRRRSESAMSKRVGEGRALVVVGESGEGKTRSLTRLFATHASLPNYGVLGGACPLVTVQAPSPCTLQQLGRATLAKLGYPIARDMRAHLVWESVNEKLKLTGTMILHFDEMQHATQTANILEIQKVANTLKALLLHLEWPVSLVLSGGPELVPFIQGDAQLRQRCDIVALAPLTADIPNKKMIAEQASGLVNLAGLTLDTANATDLGSRIMYASGMHFGVMIEIILSAIQKALERLRDERLKGVEPVHTVTIDDFVAAHFRRTGCAETPNPFLALDYVAIDARRFLQDTPTAVPPTPSPTKPTGRKKK